MVHLQRADPQVLHTDLFAYNPDDFLLTQMEVSYLIFTFLLSNTPLPNLLFEVLSRALKVPLEKVGVAGFFCTRNVLPLPPHASITLQQVTKGPTRGTHSVHDTDSFLIIQQVVQDKNNNAHTERDISNSPSCTEHWAVAVMIRGPSLKINNHHQSCFSQPRAFVISKPLDTWGTHCTKSTGYE